MQPHGRHDIEQHGQIILCRVYDAWNAEEASQFVTEVKAVVAGLNGRRWFRVINMLDWKLGTPEVTQIMHDFLVWEAAHGGAGKVYVAHPNAPLRHQVRRALDGLPEPIFLECEEDALAYARRFLNSLEEV